MLWRVAASGCGCANCPECCRAEERLAALFRLCALACVVRSVLPAAIACNTSCFSYAVEREGSAVRAEAMAVKSGRECRY